MRKIVVFFLSSLQIKSLISTQIHTLLWAFTTDERSFQVPPRRSMRTIRRIWRNLRPLIAVVAKTFPCDPRHMTINDDKITTISKKILFKHKVVTKMPELVALIIKFIISSC